MPIYMDLHIAPGATAKDIIALHQLDLEVQDEYQCSIKTAWLDVRRGQVFCLVEAPNKKAVELMHRNAHGKVPNRIIEVESSMVEMILGRISDPESFKDDTEYVKHLSKSPYRTVMIVELKEPFIAEENELIKIKPFYFDSIRNSVVKNDGIEVRHSAEEFVVFFQSSTAALKSASEIQDTFKAYNDKSSKLKINAAVGIHTGAPVTDVEEFFGATVQMTKRLCSIAESGCILMTSAVSDGGIEYNVNTADDNKVKILKPADEDFLNRLISLIEEIWNDEDFNMEKFSKLMGLSKTQLYRKVTSLTGYSPNIFLREYRLKKAVKLMKTMKGNISEIAYESGFGNPSYFTKCFHKKYGFLPSEYAKIIGV